MAQEYTVEDWLDDMAQISEVHVWDPDRQCWVWAEDRTPVEKRKEGR